MPDYFTNLLKKSLGSTLMGWPIASIASAYNSLNNALNLYTPTTQAGINLNTTTPWLQTLKPSTKNNIAEVKSTTLSKPTYNPTANTINTNAIQNVSNNPPSNPPSTPDLSSLMSGLQNLSQGLSQLQIPQQQTIPTTTPVESEADKYFKMYLESIGITPEEEALQKQLSNIITGADLGVAGLEGQGRGIPLSLVRGQQEKLLRQAAIQAQPLQKQLELLQAQRQVKAEMAKAASEYYKPKETEYKPITIGAGETLIDPKTGKVIYQGAPKEESISEKYGPGIIGEYNFYAEQEKKLGREPLTFDEYQTRDANRKIKAATIGADNDSYNLANVVLENPSLFNQLTPSEKGRIAPILKSMGFTAFGKPLSDTAIKEITEKEIALENIKNLSDSIIANKQYIGPISGLQALNPWSPAKKVLADINRVRQIVGKALEGGVLRKEDEYKYKQILPTVYDTQDTVMYKLKQLEKQIQSDIETYKNEQLLSGRQINTNKQNNVVGTVSSGNSYTIIKTP